MPGLPRTISFTTALWLYRFDLLQGPDYPCAERAQIDDAWERPAHSRGNRHPLWDQNAAWLAEIQQTRASWADELLALPYVYKSVTKH